MNGQRMQGPTRDGAIDFCDLDTACRFLRYWLRPAGLRFIAVEDGVGCAGWIDRKIDDDLARPGGLGVSVGDNQQFQVA